MFKKASREERMNRARNVDPDTFDRLMASASVGSSMECWPVNTALNKDGYAAIRIAGKKTRAHRAMFALFFPGVPAPVVRHMCHRPNCINPAHLRAGTQHDNVMDRVLAGRGGDLRGERNGRAKLTPAQIAEIRNSAESGAAIARRLGISKNMACRIRRGLAWAHITGEQ